MSDASQEGGPATPPRTTTPSWATPAKPDPRRWWGLVVIAIAQLMVVLDATIVNIALPSAQRDLGCRTPTGSG
ncbi:hypothetical protein Srufu_040300 [Streptomyces libani subsp. rufus]|nr:hypothetical protein Srufu_040300 [Streptomyces libani subsp. rufus]